MKLSMRLEAVIGMVTPGKAVLDVGCDHAFVPIELVRREISPCAAASDLRKGPLLRAEEHIRSAALEDRIRTIQADGVPRGAEAILAAMAGEQGKKADAALIITGMGGKLIAGILREADGLPALFSELVLSPHRDADSVRRELRRLGFGIADEVMVEEDGKFYPVIKAVRGSAPGSLRGGTAPETTAGGDPALRAAGENPSADAAVPGDLYGPVLIRKKDPALIRMLQRELEEYGRILGQLREKSPGRENRAGEIRRRLAAAECALRAMTSEEEQKQVPPTKG